MFLNAVEYNRTQRGFTLSPNKDILEGMSRLAGDTDCVCKPEHKDYCDSFEECQRLDVSKEEMKDKYKECRYVEIIKRYSIDVEIKELK